MILTRVKRIYYIANIRFPTERAHGIQVASMCSAFARNGAEVTLLVPDRKTISDDPFEYYGIERNFTQHLDHASSNPVAGETQTLRGAESIQGAGLTVEKIPVPDIVHFGKIGFFIESVVFAWRAARRVRKSLIPAYAKASAGRLNLRPNDCPVGLASSLTRKGKSGTEIIVYTREELPLLFLPRKSVFYEVHQLRGSLFFRMILKQARGIVAISNGLKKALVRDGYPEKQILVAPDGYDGNTNYPDFVYEIEDPRFDKSNRDEQGRHATGRSASGEKVRTQDTEGSQKERARDRLGLPQNDRIAMYIGGLEAWKGSRTLLLASDELLRADVRVAIIGGTKEEISLLQKEFPQIVFLGPRPYKELGRNQQAADVLVIPNSGTERISREFTSPLKLFAHMASGVPIVASKLPSLTEILSDANAYLVPPDDSHSLAVGVLSAISEPEKSAALAKQAMQNATEYTWDKRAKNVLAYIL